jgi:hypothetical protein
MDRERLDQILVLARLEKEAETALKVLNNNGRDSFDSFKINLQDGGFSALPDSMFVDFMQEAYEYTKIEYEVRKNAFKDV